MGIDQVLDTITLGGIGGGSGTPPFGGNGGFGGGGGSIQGGNVVLAVEITCAAVGAGGAGMGGSIFGRWWNLNNSR